MSLVQFVYAEAWATRAGAAMSSGYGKYVLKKKLCDIGGGDKPDGFGPSACQTYRDVDRFLAEPDEEKFFGTIKAYVVTCTVTYRLQRKDLPSSKANGLTFLMIIPLHCIEEREGEEVFDTIRSQLTICCGMNAAPPPPPPPGGGLMAAAAAGTAGASGGGGGGGAAWVQLREQSSMSTLTSRNSRP